MGLIMNLPVNKYQTILTDELLNSLKPEVQEQLLDIINNVEFVRRLISPNRFYAKDLPRDKSNKIIIDLANPHIVEDTDYFRPSAIHYQKYGCFTKLKPNSNPNSEYNKWFKEELRRCWEGYIRESDGEWVTGYLYWFLNYSPIELAQIIEGTKLANRVVGFPEFWEGIYWRFHYLEQARLGGIYNDFKGGQHGAELASRGKGKSYSLASILSHNFIVGVNEIANKRVTSIVTASTKEYLTQQAVLNKFVAMADFCAENTQFPRKRLKSSMQEMTWKLGYKDSELDIEKGVLNIVHGVSSKDDESKLRGKRAAHILIEEFGTFARLKDLYNIILPSVQEGNVVFGQIFMLGTAGDNKSDFEGAQEIMYNPKGYNMYSMPNVYDKINQGKPTFVFFFPGYINRKGCYNKDGVSDVITGLIEILVNRHIIKYNTADPNTILKTIAEVPITPAEAILQVKRNLFPVTDLIERLGQLDANTREYEDTYIGDLTMGVDNYYKYIPTKNTVITDFPHKDNKLEGAIQIFSMPIKDADNVIMSGRYIAGADTYDDDVSETLSLGSIFILDLMTDKIVAEFTGRPSTAEEFYEICRKLCVFYNARLNYENNKKGLFAYFSRMNALYLLTDVLSFLKDKEMIKGVAFGNKSKGTIATAAINNYARNLIKAWLSLPVTSVQNIDGVDTELTIHNLFFLRNRALILELISYNTEGNFDRISALGMLMLLREDKIIHYKGNFNNNKCEDDSAYLGNDPFFLKKFK